MFVPFSISNQLESNVMVGMGIRVAAGLMLAMLLFPGTIQAQAATASIEVQYACTDAQIFIVTRTADKAFVQFDGKTYELQRRPSSIGIKYISASAALIVDGPSAVFVADDRFQLGTCLQTTHVASSR
jgi:membrane-bound inhibitor of C-type lysozyme